MVCGWRVAGGAERARAVRESRAGSCGGEWRMDGDRWLGGLGSSALRGGPGLDTGWRLSTGGALRDI